MRTSFNQRGYSLVELLLSMAITVIATTAAMLLISKFARTAGAYGEVTALEETRASAESLMRSDFDGAGFNLTRPSQPGAGRENIQFTANSITDDYNYATPGTLSKLNNNPTYANSTRTVTSGLSLWSWTPATICKHCWGYLMGSDGNFDAIGTYYDEAGAAAIVIYDSAAGGTVASNFGTGLPIASNAPGDVYQIGVEAPNQLQTVRFVRFYRIRNGVRSILYTSQTVVPPYPQYMLAYIGEPGSAINNISVIGAPLEYLVKHLTQFAPLPFVGGTQLTSPVTISGNS